LITVKIIGFFTAGFRGVRQGASDKTE